MTLGAGDARAFFEAIARRYDRAYGLDARVSRARMARVLAEIASVRAPARARVLDLGVGTGRELSALQDAGHAIVGVDVSPAMLAACARRARPIPLVEASFWSPLPFDAASFDAVLALHGTLAHPPDERAYARLGEEIARVLAKGGVFVAEVPARAWLDALPAGQAVAEDRRVRRVASDRCIYEDLVVGASIEAFVPDEARWPELFGPTLDVRVEPLDSSERLLVARPTLAR